jgi:hypothetical protein
VKAGSIYLLPAHGDEKTALRQRYEKAIAEAAELFIVTAYLREWRAAMPLPKLCTEFRLIAGTDFGLSRKQAMRDVLSWLPKNRCHEFMATNIRGFHPKAMLWRTHSGARWLLSGSSNLTTAGMTANHEANVLTSLSEAQYKAVRAWIRSVEIDSETFEVTNEWIAEYKEAKPPPKVGSKTPKSGASTPQVPKYGTAVLLAQRRAQQARFVADRARWVALLNRCATGRIGPRDFYEKMMLLWAPSRFQARGMEILGKNSRWHITCKSLLRIVRAKVLTSNQRDSLVVREIDYLAKVRISMRGAWYSEMLCHFFPDRYPVLDAPVNQWLSARGFRASRGASQGERYLEIARLLRAVLERSRGKVRHLAELDCRIWAWSDSRK